MLANYIPYSGLFSLGANFPEFTNGLTTLESLIYSGMLCKV